MANIHLQVMKDSHTQKSDLDLSQIVKECTKEVKNDGPTHKPGINKLQIVEICNEESYSESKITSSIDIRVDEQSMRRTRSSRPATTRVMPSVTINRHLYSYFFVHSVLKLLM